jgi:RNA polymerase sigma-70 factor (ECF subfamily)
MARQGRRQVDRELVEQAKDGDREAFGVLARVHADRLYAIAHRILRDVDRSEDAVQQALVIAWREVPRLRDPDRFEPWLHRILVHACYAEARRRREWTANVRVLPVDGPAGPDEVGALADRDEVDRGFRRLPPEQRALLVLHHYLGLTPTEIADTLGIPAGTARSRLHYAHRAMRAALEADARHAPVAGGQTS